MCRLSRTRQPAHSPHNKKEPDRRAWPAVPCTSASAGNGTSGLRGIGPSAHSTASHVHQSPHKADTDTNHAASHDLGYGTGTRQVGPPPPSAMIFRGNLRHD